MMLVSSTSAIGVHHRDVTSLSIIFTLKSKSHQTLLHRFCCVRALISTPRQLNIRSKISVSPKVSLFNARISTKMPGFGCERVLLNIICYTEKNNPAWFGSSSLDMLIAGTVNVEDTFEKSSGIHFRCDVESVRGDAFLSAAASFDKDATNSCSSEHSLHITNNNQNWLYWCVRKRHLLPHTFDRKDQSGQRVNSQCTSGFVSYTFEFRKNELLKCIDGSFSLTFCRFLLNTCTI